MRPISLTSSLIVSSPSTTSPRPRSLGYPRVTGPCTSARFHPQWIIIPAFNEEESIGAVVAQCVRLHDFAVVVVDDGSTDATRRCALAHGARVLPLPIHLGAWGAVQTGLRYALRHGCRLAVTLDGDGQHDPEHIPRLAAPVLEGSADMVIGSCPQRGSPARRLAWSFFRHLTKLPVEDLTSGFRACNLPTARLLASRRATLLDYQDIGVLLLVQSAGLRIKEVPVTMCPRRNGVSRIFQNWGAVFWYLFYSGCLGISKRSYWTPLHKRAKHSSTIGISHDA